MSDRNPAGVSRAAVLGPALAATTAGVLPSFLTGALAVQMRGELHFGAAGLGLLTAAFFGSGALWSAVLGRWAQRRGPVLALQASAAVATAVMVAIAAAVHSYEALVVTLAVGGAANALAQPGANLWIIRGAPADGLGLAFGLKQSAIPLAMMLGGLAVPGLALTVGWRWAFAAGAAGAASAGMWVRWAGDRHLAVPGPAPAPGSESERVDMRPLVVLAVAVGFGAAAAGTLGSFYVAAAVASGIGAGTSGLLFAAGSAIGLSMRVALGHRADRRGGGVLGQVAVLLGGGAVGYALLSTARPAVVIAATPVAFAVGWGWPGLYNLAIVRNHAASAATATGITQTGTYLGAVAGPITFGWVAQRWGFGWAWWIAAGTSLVAASATVAGRRMLRRSRRDRGLAQIREPRPSQ